MALVQRTSRLILSLSKGMQNRHAVHSAAQHRAVPLAYNVFNKTPEEVDKNPPIILIHGLFGSKRNWEVIGKAFSRKNTVIAVDCRNHGESPSVSDMTYDLMAEDIAALMKHLNIEKANIVGHSMGGKVAMTLALHKPELISKLVVEDVAPDTERTRDSSSYVVDVLQAMQKVKFDNQPSLGAMRRSVGQQLLQAIPEEGMRSFILTNVVQKERGFDWQVNVDVIYNRFDELMAFPEIELSYEGETLFIGGSKSEHIREKHLPMISRFFPNAQVVHVQGSGHWVHAEKAREFMEIVQNFISHEKT